MAFPHPQSCEDNYRQGNIPDHGRVVWKFFKRTIDVTDYRNTKDDVYRAEDRTFCSIFHDWLFIGGTAPAIRPTSQRLTRLAIKKASLG